MRIRVRQRHETADISSEAYLGSVASLCCNCSCLARPHSVRCELSQAWTVAPHPISSVISAGTSSFYLKSNLRADSA